MMKRKEPVRVRKGCYLVVITPVCPMLGWKERMRKSAQEKYQGPVPLMDEGAIWKHNGKF